MRMWSAVAEMIASHGRCAVVTVAEVRGSAPREPGARMVIAPDGGFRGTIGGGELEWQAIGAARDVLSRDAARRDARPAHAGSRSRPVLRRERAAADRGVRPRSARRGPCARGARSRGSVRDPGAHSPARGGTFAVDGDRHARSTRGGRSRPLPWDPPVVDSPAGDDAARERPSKGRRRDGRPPRHGTRVRRSCSRATMA